MSHNFEELKHFVSRVELLVHRPVPIQSAQDAGGNRARLRPFDDWSAIALSAEAEFS